MDALANFLIGYKQRGRGPTFGDFVPIRTEGSMQDVSVARVRVVNVITTS